MKLINCHLAYLFTKNNIIIIGLTTFVFAFAFIGNASYQDSLKSEVINQYYLNSQFMGKVLLSIISIFIFANSIYCKNDFYAYFFLPNIKRKTYIITKILTNTMVLLVLSSFIFISFLIIGFIKINGFYLKTIYLQSFITITLIALIYGLYGFLFMQLLNNHFITILVYGFVIISNNLDIEANLSKILLIIIPNNRVYGVIHLIWLLFGLIIINSYLYLHKDLNY